MTNPKISAGLEDYLEAIYEIYNEKSAVKAIDIANRFKISRSSVTEALQKLAKNGYIKYGRYEPIELTPKGITAAKEVIFKHITLCKFFISVLNLTKEDAEINACKIEHIITPTAFEKIKEYVENSEQNLSHQDS